MAASELPPTSMVLSQTRTFSIGIERTLQYYPHDVLPCSSRSIGAFFTIGAAQLLSLCLPVRRATKSNGGTICLRPMQS